MKLKRTLGVAILAMACFVALAATANAMDSGTMILHTDSVVAGSHLSTGKYNVKWQTHSPEATVSFIKESKVVATVSGKVLDRGKVYSSNEVVYNEDPNGARVIQELRFRGSSLVIVFNE